MKLVWFLIALAGCSGGNRAAPPPNAASPPVTTEAPAAPVDAAPAAPVDIAVIRGKLEQLADRMCNCKDGACAREVSQELARWRAEVNQPGRILGEADTEQLMPVAQRIATCMAEAMASDSGSGARP